MLAALLVLSGFAAGVLVTVIGLGAFVVLSEKGGAPPTMWDRPKGA